MAYIITGEKIQNMCDLYLGSDKDLKYNPYIYQQKNKHLLYDSFQNDYDNPFKIYCYTHALENYSVLIENLKKFKNDFVLVLHNSDKNFNEEYISLIDDIKNLKKIYTQNLNVIYDNIHPLPIGIANSMWKHGNLNIMNKVIKDETIIKDKHIFFNFSVNTNRNKRTDCYKKIKNKGIPFLSNQNFEQYLKTLKSYEFCICPEGNGIDCHRFWECLYLRVIPVCKNNILVSYYSKHFPVVILDDWEELNVKDLKYNEYSWSNQDELDFENLSNKITLN